MKYIYLSLITVILTACGNFKHHIGWSSVAPNENEVKVLKPLEIPKTFDLPEPSKETITPKLKTPNKAPVAAPNSDLIHRAR